MSEKQLVVSLALKSGTMKQQITAINKEVKGLEAEFKNAGAGIENFGKTTEGLNAKLKLSEKTLEKLNQKLSIYKSEQEKCTQTLDKAVKSYEKQSSKVKEVESALESAKSEFGNTSKEVKDLEVELKKAQKTLETKRNGVINANNSLNQMKSTINSTEAEIKEMTSDIQKLNNEINNIDNSEIDELSDSFKKASSDTASFGADLTIIGNGIQNVGEKVSDVGKKILNLTGDFVKVGSEYSAEIASTEFLLKNLDESTQDIINSSSKLSSVLGITEKQYKENSTSIATYYKNMGMGTDTINEMTSKSIELVADLGAIADLPFDEAMSRFKSGLMGNYQALDIFGINLSANTIGNSEFAKSLGDSWNKLSDNEKMMATYKEILRQSSSAIGLAKQEAQEFGMKTKYLSTRLEELKGSIGEKLLPTLEPFLGKINKVVESISTWVEENPKLATTIVSIVASLGAVLTVGGTLIGTIGMLIISWGAITTAIAGATIPFLAIAGAIAGIVGGIILLAGAIKNNFNGITSAIENLKAKFTESFSNVRDTFTIAWQTMKSIYDSLIKPLFDNLGILIEHVINFIASIMPSISTTFKIVFEVIKAVWESIGKPLADAIISVFKWAVDWFGENYPLIAEVFNTVIDRLKSVWDNVGKPLFNLIKSVIEYTINFITPLIKSIGIAFEIAWGVFKASFNVTKPVIDFIIELVGRLSGACINAGRWITESFSNAFSEVASWIDWISNKIKGFIDWLSGLGSKVGGFLSRLNPFSNETRSIDINTNVNYTTVPTGKMYTIPNFSGIERPTLYLNRAMPSLDNIALSGSYYNVETRDSMKANNIIRQANGFGNISSGKGSSSSITSEIFKTLEARINANESNTNNTLNTLAKAIADMSVAINNLANKSQEVQQINLKADVSLDRRNIIKNIAQDIEPLLIRKNNLALR